MLQRRSTPKCADGRARRTVERHANCMKGWSMSLGAAVSTEKAQRRVDGYFAMRVSAWTEIYSSAGLVPSIFQQRLAGSLPWIEEIALAPRERVVDVGCGGGVAAGVLAQRGVVVDAVDTADGLVRRTRP